MTATKQFTNKSAIVTGAGTGIGYEIAFQLAQEGASVLINDFDPEVCNKAAQNIAQKTGSNIIPLVGDAGNVTFIYQMVAKAAESFGKVDMVIANAGITLFGSFLEFSADSFQKVTNLNLQGSFFLSQAFAKQVIAQGSPGNILLMSSNIGFRAYPNLSAYGMTKAGIKMLATTLTAELSPLGIRINAVAPGATLTERTAIEEDDYWGVWSKITPLNKIATTEDIAQAAMFLLSDKAGHITGQTLVVDGGWEATGLRPHN
jgi:glucose 1-dehydrogenase